MENCMPDPEEYMPNLANNIPFFCSCCIYNKYDEVKSLLLLNTDNLSNKEKNRLLHSLLRAWSLYNIRSRKYRNILLDTIENGIFKCHDIAQYVLSYIINTGNIEIIKFVLDNFELTDDKLSLAFSSSCENGNVEIAKLMIGYGAKINNKCAVIKAHCKGHLDIIVLLLDNGLDRSLLQEVIYEAPCNDRNIHIIKHLYKKCDFPLRGLLTNYHYHLKFRH
jgi:ankyrin repeat protein